MKLEFAQNVRSLKAFESCAFADFLLKFGENRIEKNEEMKIELPEKLFSKQTLPISSENFCKVSRIPVSNAKRYSS